MAKATEQTALSLKVDPRVRMKEIRAEVNAHLKGDTLGLAHLGDLPDNMEDARRVIIAVQDLLEVEREKHRKATVHVCELVHITNLMSENQVTLLQMNDHLERVNQNLNGQIESQGKYINSMGQEITQTMRERDAVLTTMKLMNQPQVKPMKPLPMMSVGLTMKDRL